jgi:RHH-type transcriptional regulator, rel operon repressor / antitoxin RelB
MTTSIRLNPAIESRLSHLAKTTGRSKAFYLRELIARGLDDLEDRYRALDVMERVRKGEVKVSSASQVSQRLGFCSDLVPVADAQRSKQSTGILALRGTGKGLWGKSPNASLGVLRDEWSEAREPKL